MNRSAIHFSQSRILNARRGGSFRTLFDDADAFRLFRHLTVFPPWSTCSRWGWVSPFADLLRCSSAEPMTLITRVPRNAATSYSIHCTGTVRCSAID
jgi:hypothetical protein